MKCKCDFGVSVFQYLGLIKQFEKAKNEPKYNTYSEVMSQFHKDHLYLPINNNGNHIHIIIISLSRSYKQLGFPSHRSSIA